jgi:hypothetical protein
MQRLFVNVCRRGVAHSKPLSSCRPMYNMPVPERTMPTDAEQAFGRRRLEVDAEAQGEVGLSERYHAN